MAAIRSKDAYLAAQNARLKPRRGHKKALGAVKHLILCACWPGARCPVDRAFASGARGRRFKSCRARSVSRHRARLATRL